MIIFKKLFFLGFCLFLVLSVFSPASARENSGDSSDPVEMFFFYSPTCPFCNQEKVFLNEMEDKYPMIAVNRYNVVEGNNVEILKKMYQDYKVPEEQWGLIPATFIGRKYFLGFDKGVTDQEIEEQIAALLSVAENPEESASTTLVRIWEKIPIPFFGAVDLTKFPPFGLSAIVGAVDGFNVCAMIALGFLLAVLVAAGDRKRIILIGGVFILVSGIVYFIFIAAWLNIFLFLGYLRLITIIVGIVIIIFSILILKDYFYGLICRICEIEQGKESRLTGLQRRFFAKLAYFTSAEIPIIVSLAGVALVAAGINTVELFCSLGFPLAYAKLLTSYQLAPLHYYFNLSVYVVFYMIDDFIIFMIAVFTLRITGVSKKYLKVLKLAGGVILLILGILILLRPGILTFGS